MTEVEGSHVTDPVDGKAVLEGISAVTLAVGDMTRTVRFYRALGFTVRFGDETAPFTSFQVGSNHLNLALRRGNVQQTWWGRIIFYVSDVDASYERAIAVARTPSGTSVTSISPIQTATV